MELDDLKGAWKANAITQTPINTDIMKIILQKSTGPIAQLKSGYRKQILFMSLLPFVLLLTNLDNIYGVLTSVMFWSYTVFCMAVIIVASLNYRTAARMEGMDRVVKPALEMHIDLLQKRLDGLVIGLRIALVYFIVLTEVLPYFQHYRMLAYWHSLSPFIRFGAYAILLIAQYFLGRKKLDYKFRRHLDHLKSLVGEMQ